MAELIVALDVPSGEEAICLVDSLPGLSWAKVGPMLFLREGRDLVDRLKRRNIKVFLDLKWHDIPNSVAEATRAAAQIGVDMATVHSLGGATMIQAAVEGAGDMRIAAVTVLTSVRPPPPPPQRGGLGGDVVRLAALASQAGAQAIVCSPLEVGAVRETIGPDPWIVTPGIRLPGAAADDQQRTATPEAAVAAGSTHLVVGRPILRAESPVEVYLSIRRTLS